METDAAVDKDQRTSILVHSGLEKPAGFSHRFHRHGGDEPKTTKPDRSFATKTGHFYLLLTEVFPSEVFPSVAGFPEAQAGSAQP